MSLEQGWTPHAFFQPIRIHARGVFGRAAPDGRYRNHAGPRDRNYTVLSTPPESAPPTAADYPIILRGSKNEIIDRRPSVLYAIACEQGWPATCGQGNQAEGSGRSR